MSSPNNSARLSVPNGLGSALATTHMKRKSPTPRVGSQVISDDNYSQILTELRNMNNNNNARFDKMEELNTSTVREVQRLASSLDNAIHVAVDAQNRAKHAESELHAVKQHLASVAPGELDKVIRWYEDTRRADIDFEAISGHAFIQAPNNIAATPQSIASTINTDKPVIQKIKRDNQPSNSFRVLVGPRGREGTIAVNNFLLVA